MLVYICLPKCLITKASCLSNRNSPGVSVVTEKEAIEGLRREGMVPRMEPEDA